jgi:YegS/Rv2252/BmrU family lipid kinase
VNNGNKQVFFIVNKFSGTGFKPELENMFADACKANTFEYELEYTQGPGHATQLAREAVRAGFEKIVAVGGDGTVNEVAQGVIHQPAAMGIIPKGSGNGLARHLGIPVKVHHALQCLFRSKTIDIDTFSINGKLSLNVSGIGFDGYIADLFGTDKRRGFQGYTRLVLNEFSRFQEFDADVIAGDAHTRAKAFVIAVANSSQYGNNARIAPAASVCDQLLDISILKKFPAYRLDFIYSFFSGTIDKSSYCETLQVRDATIKLAKPMSYHVDGEPAGKADTFTIALEAASLKMLAPCVGKF